MERVVITGMGTVNPLGLNVEQTWKNILNGVSGVGPITLFDPRNLLVKIACEVKVLTLRIICLRRKRAGVIDTNGLLQQPVRKRYTRQGFQRLKQTPVV